MMTPIINLFYPTFTSRGKITTTTLTFFAILLLANWRLIWGWFYYYTEYYLAFRGESDIGAKCVYILKEPNFWKRVRNSKDWWWRMRCEGNLAGSASLGNFLNFEFNVLEWYWVKTAIAIFNWELPEVAIPEENGVSLLMETAKDAYHYVWPAVLVPSFYVWSFISWAIVTPFAVAGACIADAVSTVYNFKLPAIALPDIDDLPLIPALPREFLRNLPKPSFKHLPSISLPPFSELPIIKDIIPALLNIDVLGLIFSVVDILLWVVWAVLILTSSPFFFIGDRIIWVLTKIPWSSLQGAIHIPQWWTALCSIFSYQELDQHLNSALVHWQLFFFSRYIFHWVVWLVLIIPRGLWAMLKIADTAFIFLVYVAWPVFLGRLEKLHPTALYDFIYMIVLLIIITFSLTVDELFHDSRYGFRGIPLLLLRLPADICMQIYYFYRRMIRRYRLNEIYLDDILEFLLQKIILRVVYKAVEISVFVFFLVPVYLYYRSKSLHPIMKVLVLIGTVIGAVVSLIAVFYLFVLCKFLAWYILSPVARKWSQGAWQDRCSMLGVAFLAAVIIDIIRVYLVPYLRQRLSDNRGELFLDVLTTCLAIAVRMLLLASANEVFNEFQIPIHLTFGTNLWVVIIQSIMSHWAQLGLSAFDRFTDFTHRVLQITGNISGRLEYLLAMVLETIRGPFEHSYVAEVVSTWFTVLLASALGLSREAALAHVVLQYVWRMSGYLFKEKGPPLLQALLGGISFATFGIIYPAFVYMYSWVPTQSIARWYRWLVDMLTNQELPAAGEPEADRDEDHHGLGSDDDDDDDDNDEGNNGDSYPSEPPGSGAGFANPAQANEDFDQAVPVGRAASPTSSVHTVESEQTSQIAEESATNEEPVQSGIQNPSLVPSPSQSTEEQAGSTASDPGSNEGTKSSETTMSSGEVDETQEKNTPSPAAQNESGPEV